MIKFDDLEIVDNNLKLTAENISKDDTINRIRFKDIEFTKTSFVNNKILYNNNEINYSRLAGINSNSAYDLYFKNCTFKDMLEFNGRLDKTIRFDSCNFNDIILKGLYKNPANDNIENGVILKKIESLNNITIDSCKFNGKFYINKQYDEDMTNKKVKINKLIIKDTEFKDNFKLHNCAIEEVVIVDTDFEKNADFYLSHFKSGIKKEDKSKNIIFKALNFRSLALFGNTIFDKKFDLQYVTIEGYSHFRKSEFKEGLNLNYVNIQNEMNFFGVKGLASELSRNNTSQETYRIIKHNFEKLGNKIEANKYHALELEQKRKNLKKENGSWKEKLVFNIHNLSSEHSTNWFRALLGIFTVGLLTIMLVHSDIIIDLFFNPDNFDITYISKAWDELLRFIYIGYMEDDLKEHPFTFLFNKVSLGYLYYQFLMSVRKDTRK